jgi:hypothetical protein
VTPLSPSGIPAQAKKDLGYVEADDGCFWISWDDFQSHFNRIYVCRVAETCDGYQFTSEAALRGGRGPQGTWCEVSLRRGHTATAGGTAPCYRTHPTHIQATPLLRLLACFYLSPRPMPPLLSPLPDYFAVLPPTRIQHCLAPLA